MRKLSQPQNPNQNPNQQQQPPQGAPQQQQYYAPPPPYPPPAYFYAPQQQNWIEKLSWKQRIIGFLILLTIAMFLAMWNSCHPQTTITNKTTQQPGNLPANPQTIESQREAAERELAQAQANAEAAKQRALRGPSMAPAPQQPTGPQTQNPDAQFWAEMRHAKWRREQEAPYASGVGFVTKLPPDERKEQANNEREPEPKPATEQPKDPATSEKAKSPQNYDFDRAHGPVHRLDEGTIIPSVLLNQLDGEFNGPVICQISEDIYDAPGLHLLIPAGSKVLGEAQAVNSNNQRRLAVIFHRLIMPDGYSISLDKSPGLDQLGATALAGKVNNHYLQTFSMALAVGAIAGLSQIGNNGAIYSPSYGFREGVSNQTAMTSEQILNRYLNRHPTITIQPGTRVKIILIADLPGIPEYANHDMPIDR